MSAGEETFERVFWQVLNDLQEGEAKPIESYLRLVPREDREELSLMLADVLLARGPASAPAPLRARGTSGPSRSSTRCSAAAAKPVFCQAP